jgi:cytochrome c biogenesis protein CcdA
MISIFMVPEGSYETHIVENSQIETGRGGPVGNIPSGFRRNGGDGGNISLAFFYEYGCTCTQQAMRVLNNITEKYPDVNQFWYNLSGNESANNVKLIKFFKAYNVPGNIRDAGPFIFIGDHYLNEYSIQNDSVSEVIDLYHGMAVPLWPAWELTWSMHIAFFYDPGVAGSLAALSNIELLNSTWNHNASHVIVHNYSLENPTNRLLFDAYFSTFNLSTVTSYENTDGLYAAVFISDVYLLNSDITYESLNNTVTLYSGHNTPLHDISIDVTGGSIHILIFYSPTCYECHRARNFLKDMKAKYPDLAVHEYNTADPPENGILKDTYFEYYNVPVKKWGTLGVFIGDKYFVDAESLENGLETQIKRYEGGIDYVDLEPDKEIVKKTFNSLTILAVMGAGLVDSVNPCAIATLIFFIGYLSVTGRTKRQILIIGMAYTLGIFVTYMALGLGFYYLIAASSNQLDVFSRLLFPVMAIITILFGVYSLYDFNKARKGKKEEMKLQLPKYVKGLIGRVIKHQVKLRYFALIAILTGVVISILEFVCTGQVYIPTIVLIVATVPELQTQAIGLLLLYNVMFVLPLIIIFTFVYFGMSSEQLTNSLDRNRALIKLMTAVLFFCLGAWLMWYSMGIV